MKRAIKAVRQAPATPASLLIAFVWSMSIGFVIAMSIPRTWTLMF